MQASPRTTAAPAADPRIAERPAAALAALALLALSVPLAAPGLELVPGADEGSPRWVTGLFGDGLGISPGLYLAALYAAVGAWVALVWARPTARVAKFAIAGAVTLFALAPPLLSLDVFSYISYARLGVEHGLNPYVSVPADIPGDEAAARVDDFRFAVSVYGPLFTLGSYPIGAAGVALALWIFKAIAALSVLGIAWLTARLAALRGVAPATAAAFVALNPLVLVHVVGGAHNDGLMVLVGLLGVLAASSGRAMSAGVALACSAAVKAAGLLYAPFFAVAPGQRTRLIAGFALAAVAIGAVTLAAFGGSATEALGVAGDNQATVSHWSVPATAGRITGLDVDVLRPLFAGLYGLAVIGLLLWTARGADPVRAAGWAALGLLVATAWMVPWYVIWLLPLAAVSRDRPLIAGAVALTLFQAINAVPV